MRSGVNAARIEIKPDAFRDFAVELLLLCNGVFSAQQAAWNRTAFIDGGLRNRRDAWLKFVEEIRNGACARSAFITDKECVVWFVLVSPKLGFATGNR